MEGGDLRQYLMNNKLAFKGRLRRLSNIAAGLKKIHKQGLIHRDFHPGNILSGGLGGYSYITDLGLCKPANEITKEEKIYGVMPYVAPEVLQSKPYTQASDIYSLGIVMYEIFSNACPYLDREYDTSLASDICRGLRPSLDEVKIPQLLKNLIQRC